MVIRKAKDSDLAQIAFLWYERISLLQQTHSYFTLLPDAMHIWQHEASHWINNDKISFFVAEDESHIVGYIVVTIIKGPIGLRPDYIGKIIDMGLDLHQTHPQLGKRLVTQAVDWLRIQNINILSVDLSARYPVEEAFWRSQGAKLIFNEYWMVI